MFCEQCFVRRLITKLPPFLFIFNFNLTFERINYNNIFKVPLNYIKLFENLIKKPLYTKNELSYYLEKAIFELNF
jgi:hypothetical protein